MADEQRDAGQAMSRPRVARPVQATSTDSDQAGQPATRPAGAAPGFDPETGQLVRRPVGGGMLGNRWVRQWGGQDSDRDEPGEHGRSGEPGEQGRDSGPADAGQAPHTSRRAHEREAHDRQADG